MERSKTWTKPWMSNPAVAGDRNAFPSKRPGMAVSSKNSPWIDAQIHMQGPVVPNLERGRPWQPNKNTLDLFSKYEPDKDTAIGLAGYSGARAKILPSLRGNR